MSVLPRYIDNQIVRSDKKLLGHAVSTPYKKNINALTDPDEIEEFGVWVVDVLVRSDLLLVTDVPIAENNRRIKDFVTDGTPVELQRSKAGQFYISGLSDVQRGTVTQNTYTLASAGLAFTEGWRLNSNDNFETGNENEVDEGTAETTNFFYTFAITPLGDLDFGITPLQQKIATKVEA